MAIFKKKKEVMTGFQSRAVNVVVEKIINGNLIQEVAEFTAWQDKSDSKSLVIKSDEMDFIEELDFTENEIISILKESLEFRGNTKEEKVKHITSKIEKQTKKINSIKDGYLVKVGKDGVPLKKTDGSIDRIQVNRIDEDRKLRLLEVLKQHILDYDDAGVYEIINIDGMREIRFLLVEDFLYPLYRSPHNKTIYPNMVTKKKVYKVQRDLAQKEYEDATTSKIGNFFKNAMPFFIIGLLMINIIWSINIGMRESDLQGTIQEEIVEYQNMLSACDERSTIASTKCAFFLSEFTKDNQELMSYANQQMSLLTDALNESITKNQNIGTNKLREQVVDKIVDEVVN